ncbi:unnamed protein product [Bursaphelenchus xylophilus]|uniref:(pine wood nematode) hypothetical protein n=1 Tax=Bursaphelenchus xylophilus TaxID=6326 RepID=A0A7I8XJH1_BURXY|nr:unnamed protein product [Bursaphelenchus xylophilus]CAG9118396.1 unnamed protein product [Bursaphelenchus xylophilus]
MSESMNVYTDAMKKWIGTLEKKEEKINRVRKTVSPVLDDFDYSKPDTEEELERWIENVKKMQMYIDEIPEVLNQLKKLTGHLEKEDEDLVENILGRYDEHYTAKNLENFENIQDKMRQLKISPEMMARQGLRLEDGIIKWDLELSHGRRTKRESEEKRGKGTGRGRTPQEEVPDGQGRVGVPPAHSQVSSEESDGEVELEVELEGERKRFTQEEVPDRQGRVDGQPTHSKAEDLRYGAEKFWEGRSGRKEKHQKAIENATYTTRQPEDIDVEDQFLKPTSWNKHHDEMDLRTRRLSKSLRSNEIKSLRSKCDKSLRSNQMKSLRSNRRTDSLESTESEEDVARMKGRTPSRKARFRSYSTSSESGRDRKSIVLRRRAESRWARSGSSSRDGEEDRHVEYRRLKRETSDWRGNQRGNSSKSRYGSSSRDGEEDRHVEYPRLKRETSDSRGHQRGNSSKSRTNERRRLEGQSLRTRCYRRCSSSESSSESESDGGSDSSTSQGSRRWKRSQNRASQGKRRRNRSFRDSSPDERSRHGRNRREKEKKTTLKKSRRHSSSSSSTDNDYGRRHEGRELDTLCLYSAFEKGKLRCRCLQFEKHSHRKSPNVTESMIPKLYEKNYTGWKRFIVQYNSLIGLNPNYLPMQKNAFLRGRLGRDETRIVESLDPGMESLRRTLKSLERHFSTTKTSTMKMLMDLFDLPTMYPAYETPKNILRYYEAVLRLKDARYDMHDESLFDAFFRILPEDQANVLEFCHGYDRAYDRGADHFAQWAHDVIVQRMKRRRFENYRRESFGTVSENSEDERRPFENDDVRRRMEKKESEPIRNDREHKQAIRCYFCQGKHNGRMCGIHYSAYLRRKRIQQLKACEKCLMNHSGSCDAEKCERCGEDHHKLICVSPRRRDIETQRNQGAIVMMVSDEKVDCEKPDELNEKNFDEVPGKFEKPFENSVQRRIHRQELYPIEIEKSDDDLKNFDVDIENENLENKFDVFRAQKIFGRRQGPRRVAETLCVMTDSYAVRKKYVKDDVIIFFDNEIEERSANEMFLRKKKKRKRYTLKKNKRAHYDVIHPLENFMTLIQPDVTKIIVVLILTELEDDAVEGSNNVIEPYMFMMRENLKVDMFQTDNDERLGCELRRTTEELKYDDSAIDVIKCMNEERCKLDSFGQRMIDRWTEWMNGTKKKHFVLGRAMSDSTEPGVIHDVSTRWNLWRERDVPCVNCFPSCFSPMFENVRWRDPEAESLNHDTVTFSEVLSHLDQIFFMGCCCVELL